MAVKRWMKWTGGVLAVLIIGFLAMTLVLLALLFSPAPKPRPLVPGPEDFAVQNRIIGRVIREVAQKNPPAESTVVLSPAEFASLLRVADGSFAVGQAISGKQKTLPPRYYAPKLIGRQIDLVVPVDTGSGWLFGGWVIAELSVAVEKDEDELDVKILSCRVGKYRLSPEFASEVADNVIEQLRQDPNYQLFDRVVKSVKINDDGNLVITYRPKEALKVLLGR